jgi:serine/threonine protein kinase
MATGELPERIGNYTLQKNELGVPTELGKGAFAHVYLAQNQSGEDVAIKLLAERSRNLFDEDDLRREGEILKYLQQFHYRYILSFIEQAEYSGGPYIVVQRLPGGTLRARLRGKPLEIGQAITIIRQIGEAISLIHQHGLVHCDITPDNIVFDEDDQAILTDFGIIIQLPPHINAVKVFPVRGTPHYMAPEQFEGIITRKCDQYSLGCIAYELFTGTHPIEPVTSPDISKMNIMKEQHSNKEPKDPCTVNKDLDNFIGKATLKALAKAPEERHEDVITFVKALYQPLHITVTTGSYARQVSIEGPAEVSTDLHLPEDVFSAFYSLLDWAGFTARSDESARSLENRRWCTRVWEKSFVLRESPSRALIYIPEGILVNPIRANRESIAYICTAFEEDSILVIVSESTQSPDSEIQRIIDEDWKKQGKKGIFLLWNRFNGLIRHKAEIERKGEKLAEAGITKEKDLVKKEIKGLLYWSNAPSIQPTGNNPA